MKGIYTKDSREARAYRRRKMMEQKLMGFLTLIICLIVFLLCSGPATPIEDDATPIVLLAPLGFWLLFSKRIVIY